MSNTLGFKINELRQENKLSLRELGKLADVSAMYICEIEGGLKTPQKSEALYKIAKALNYDLTELQKLAYEDNIRKSIAVYNYEFGLDFISKEFHNRENIY